MIGSSSPPTNIVVHVVAPTGVLSLLAVAVSGLQLVLAVVVFRATRRTVRLGQEIALEATLPQYELAAHLRGRQLTAVITNRAAVSLLVKVEDASGLTLCDEALAPGASISPRVDVTDRGSRGVVIIQNLSMTVRHRYVFVASTEDLERAKHGDVRVVSAPERTYSV